jgi:hypothetical protein
MIALQRPGSPKDDNSSCVYNNNKMKGKVFLQKNNLEAENGVKTLFL